MKDPTREELLEYIEKNTTGFDPFDVEEAIYWFAANHHGGQGSNLYSVLSTSEYHPGPSTRGPSDDMLYNDLVAEFG